MITGTLDIRSEERNTTAKAITENSDEEHEHKCAFIMNVEVGKLLADYGATLHIINMSMFHKLDNSCKTGNQYNELANGERSNNVGLKRGTSSMKFADSRGECVEIALTSAFYFPTFT